MAFTNTWNAANEASPAAGDAISGGAEAIRDLKLDIRERMAKDHYMDIAGTDADHGEHSKVTFQAAISAPTPVAGKCFIYTKVISGQPELFWMDGDSNETQLTSGGDLLISGLGTLSADVTEMLGAANYAAIRTLLSLVPGTNVQAYAAALATLSTPTAWRLYYAGASGYSALALGATTGVPLVTKGAAAAPAFDTVATAGIANGAVTQDKLQDVVAGTTLTLGIAATQRYTQSTSYVKLKELTAMLRGGTVTVTFNLWSNYNIATASARIYVDGVFVGATTHTTTISGDWESKTENIVVTVGQVISIYAKISNGALTASIKNVYVTGRDSYATETT